MVEEKINNAIEISPKVRRQIQLIQLEILLEIDRICTENNINYRIVGGTLLGAVRHKGFIPWDPDADISMSRNEYNRFFEVCKTSMNKEKFFLQEWRTDPNYRWNYSRVLRNNTEFVRAGHEHLNTKNGIFVDILCTDAVPNIKILRPIHCFCCFAIRKVLWSEVGKNLASTRLQRFMYKLLSKIPRDLVFLFRDWVISWSDGEVPYLTRNMGHKVSQYSSSKWGYPTGISVEDVEKIKKGELSFDDNYIRLEFEGYMLKAAKSYERSLSTVYGDYMKLPPPEKRVSHIPCSKIKLVKPEIKNYDELMKKIYKG